MHWEYLTIQWGPSETWQGIGGKDALDAMLNSQGQEGWELVTAVQVGGDTQYVFRQPAR
jgi:hypothetical protein